MTDPATVSPAIAALVRRTRAEVRTSAAYFRVSLLSPAEYTRDGASITGIITVAIKAKGHIADRRQPPPDTQAQVRAIGDLTRIACASAYEISATGVGWHPCTLTSDRSKQDPLSGVVHVSALTTDDITKIAMAAIGPALEARAAAAGFRKRGHAAGAGRDSEKVRKDAV